MALPFPVGSPVGALVATSLTGTGRGGCSLVIPLLPHPHSSRLLEVGTRSSQTEQQAGGLGEGLVTVLGIGVSADGE